MESRGRTPWLVTTALVLLPASALAEQLDYGVRSGVAWGSNVFGTAENAQNGLNGQNEKPVSDYSVRLSPFASVSDPDGNLTWSLRYQPTYEHYLTETDLDGFDQNASGSMAWRFADRWTFRLSEDYALYQSPVRFNESSGNPANPVILRVRNSEIQSNQANAVLQYGLGPRDSLALITNYNLTTYSQGTGNDRNTPSAALAYQHIVSERTTVGTRFSWIQQSIKRQSGQNDTSTFYNVAGTLEHAFSPTFRLEASAGPTLIDSTPADEFELPQFALAFNGNQALVFNEFLCTTPGRATVPNFGGCAGLPINEADKNTLLKITKKVPTVDAQLQPLDVSGSSASDLTYFARLALIKDWETWHGELAYERANSDTANFGSSSVADSIVASLRWNPLRLWTFNLVGAVSLQENSTEGVAPQQYVLVNVPTPSSLTTPGLPLQLAEVQSLISDTQSNAEKYQTQSVSFSATRQLTEHASAFAALYWYTQRQDINFPTDQVTRWNNLTLWIGLDWQFDSIRF